MSKLSVKIKKTDMAFIACFCIVAAYMLWTVPFGIASSDESFYLTVPYRLTQGDIFFVDEWHVSQLTGFLLYPLMRLFLAFSGSTDGVYLAFRYYFVAVAAFSGLFVYLRGRRISPTAAIIAALLLMLYNSFSIRALSYNSMGVFAMTLATVTLATTDKHKTADGIFAGLCLAAAVLCCPYLALLYLLYAVLVGVLLLRRRKNKTDILDEYAFSGSGFLSVTVGVGILFVTFCVFTLSRASLGELIRAFPNLFRDPEHVDMGMLWFVKNYVYCIITSGKYALPLLGLWALNLGVIIIDKNRIKHRLFYGLAAMLLSLLYLTADFPSAITSSVMFPLSYLGFAAYLLCEKKQKSIFRLVFVPGLLYTVCLHRASNQRYIGICNACTVCAAASVFFIVQLIRELAEETAEEKGAALKKAVAVVMSGFLLFTLAMELHTRTTKFYQDTNIREFTCLIDRGVQKGLLVSPEKAEEYYRIWDDTEKIRREPEGYVLYVTEYTWLPVGDTKKTACYSGWTLFDKPLISTPLIAEYLNERPEKLPAYIYVTNEMTYSYQPAVDGMLLMDIINVENRPVIKTDAGYMVGN